MPRYSLGLDYGTESVRALVIDCDSGDERAQAVMPYPHGVITETLPGLDQPLPHDFALQHPGDWLECGIHVIRQVLEVVPAREIIGMGVDFTACTMLPVLADGTPLMTMDRFKGSAHAWPKLWKHHAAQGEAERISEVAIRRAEGFLEYYSGVISSEWLLPKCLEIARRDPDVYERADLFVEAGDWLVQQITGTFVRNACAAGYKGLWSAALGSPSKAFLAEVDPLVEGVVEKWLTHVVPAGKRAGTVTASFAERSGLLEGMAVSVATIDAHSGVPGMGISGPGSMSVIMGTSSCHMVLSEERILFDGYAGVVKDGILPGLYGYESGQAAVGDIFGWFAQDVLSPPGDPFKELSEKAARLGPGESGLLCLDWMNGNRSVLMDARLSGMLLGVTLSTRPEHIYRSLIEGCAFGTRVILESYTGAGIPIHELVVCGGLTKDPMIMQLQADVTGLPVKVAASDQAVALGAAIFGALAATEEGGGFDRIDLAISKMTRPALKTYRPRKEATAIYDEIYRLYLGCHDHFGRENTHLMRDLKEIRDRSH